MEKKLEQLLLEKKFQQLTAEEKYYVTEYLEEAEYDRMHLFLKNSKAVLEIPPALNPKLKEKLMASFRQQHGKKLNKKRGIIVQLMRYRIPAWQAAAAILLLLGFHFGSQDEPQIVEKTETVFVHSTDTIYKEVAMPVPNPERTNRSQPRLNVGPNKPQLLADSTLGSFAINTNRNRIDEMDQPSDTFAIQVSHPRGQSVAQTKELWELLSEVY